MQIGDLVKLEKHHEKPMALGFVSEGTYEVREIERKYFALCPDIKRAASNIFQVKYVLYRK